jgi:hypothetical protein
MLVRLIVACLEFSGAPLCAAPAEQLPQAFNFPSRITGHIFKCSTDEYEEQRRDER